MRAARCGADTTVMTSTVPATPDRPRLWARRYAAVSLPWPVRVLSWAPALAIPVLLFGPQAWQWPTIVTGLAAMAIHGWSSGRETARATRLLPAFTEIAVFAQQADEVVVALALAAVPAKTPASALDGEFRRAVASVLAHVDAGSCVDGHRFGCAHRRDATAWRTWLARPATPALP
jgi:hypothetical protein